MKCLAKDRRERYDSANDLAKDISLYLDGQPVSAHPPSFTYRLRKVLNRHRVAAGVTLAIACSILLGVAGMAIGLREAIIARQAEQRRAHQLAESMYSDLINSAWSATTEHNAARASDLLERCSKEMRGWEWEFVHHRANETGHVLLRDSGNSGVTAIELQRDGTLMACVLANGNLEVRDRNRNSLVHEVNLQGDVTAAAFSDDRLVVGTSNGSLHWMDTSDWQRRHELRTGYGGIYDVGFDDTFSQFAVCTGTGAVGLFETESRELLEEWQLPTRCSGLLFFSTKGSTGPGTGWRGTGWTTLWLRARRVCAFNRCFFVESEWSRTHQ